MSSRLHVKDNVLCWPSSTTRLGSSFYHICMANDSALPHEVTSFPEKRGDAYRAYHEFLTVVPCVETGMSDIGAYYASPPSLLRCLILNRDNSYHSHLLSMRLSTREKLSEHCGASKSLLLSQRVRSSRYHKNKYPVRIR